MALEDNLGLEGQMIDTSETISMGTTTLALKYDKGIILAADSRTTAGQLIHNRVSDKIDCIHKRIFALKSGNAAHSQWLVHITKHYVEGIAIEMDKLPPVKAAARLFQEIIYGQKDSLSSAVIIAGWDPYMGPQIYQVPLGGTFIETPIATGGSGSTYIHGFVDTNFKEGMSKAQAKEFAKMAVSLAMYRDGSSGGVIRIVDISEEGVEREYIPYDKLLIKQFIFLKLLEQYKFLTYYRVFMLKQLLS